MPASAALEAWLSGRSAATAGAIDPGAPSSRRAGVCGHKTARSRTGSLPHGQSFMLSASPACSADGGVAVDNVAAAPGSSAPKAASFSSPCVRV